MIVSAAMSAAVVIAAVVSWFMLVSPTRIAFVNYQTVVLGQIAAGKDIATSKILAKVGPVLGLMGTLIPMGPALVGLSTGDIASMAHNIREFVRPNHAVFAIATMQRPLAMLCVLSVR